MKIGAGVAVKGVRYRVREAACMGRNCLELGRAKRDGEARRRLGLREGDPVCTYWDVIGCPAVDHYDAGTRRRLREFGGWRFDEGTG
jgi:hypothetical protein